MKMQAPAHSGQAPRYYFDSSPAHRVRVPFTLSIQARPYLARPWGHWPQSVQAAYTRAMTTLLVCTTAVLARCFTQRRARAAAKRLRVVSRRQHIPEPGGTLSSSSFSATIHRRAPALRGSGRLFPLGDSRI